MELKKSFEVFKKHKSVCNVSNISGGLHYVLEDKNQETKEPWIKCRHIVFFFSFWVEFFYYALRTTIGVTIVAMVNNTALGNEEKVTSESCQELVVNTTDFTEQLKKKDGEFVWSPELQGFILGSSNLFFAVSTVIMGKLTEVFGAKILLFWGLFLSSLFTFLSPFAAWFNVYMLIAVQGLRGIAQSSVFPAESAIIANWYPKAERGFSFTIILSGSSWGAMAGSYLSGLLCNTSLLEGWPLAFFVIGGSGIMVSILLGLFLYDNPNVHPNISQAELKYITENQERALGKERPKTPWRRMLSSPALYALAYAYFGQMWALTYFMTIHPTFLGTILHYSIEQNGLFSALPFLLQILTTVFSGWISQFSTNRNCMSVDTSRKFFNFLSSFGYSACLLGMYFAGCHRSVTIVLSIMSSAFIGFSYAGCWVVSVDMSPTFTASVNAFCCTIGNLATFIMPVVVGWLTNGNQTIEQWNKIMFISIGVAMSSGIAFVVFGSADVQPWNDPEKTSHEKKEDTRL